jgi:hypothetical protein
MDVKILFCLFHNIIHMLLCVCVCVYIYEIHMLFCHDCKFVLGLFDIFLKKQINLCFIIDQILYSFIIHSPIILSWNMIFKSFKQSNITPSFHCTIASLLFSSLSTGRVTMGSLTCFPTNMAMIHQQHVSKIMFVALK